MLREFLRAVRKKLTRTSEIDNAEFMLLNNKEKEVHVDSDSDDGDETVEFERENTKKQKCEYLKLWLYTASKYTILIGIVIFVTLVGCNLFPGYINILHSNSGAAVTSTLSLSAEDMDELDLFFRIRASMDVSYDPCKNMFAFACGGWITNNFIPASCPDLNSWDPFDKSQWEINNWVEALLMSPVNHNESRPLLVQAKTFFNACTKYTMEHNGTVDVDISSEKNSETTIWATTILDDLIEKVNARYPEFSMPAFLGMARNVLGMNYGFRTVVSPYSIFSSSSVGYGIQLKKPWADVSWEVPIELVLDPLDFVEKWKLNELLDLLISYPEEYLIYLPEDVTLGSKSQWNTFFHEMFNGIATNLDEVFFKLDSTELDSVISSSYHFNDAFDRTFWIQQIEEFLEFEELSSIPLPNYGKAFRKVTNWNPSNGGVKQRNAH